MINGFVNVYNDICWKVVFLEEIVVNCEEVYRLIVSNVVGVNILVIVGFDV